MPLRRRFHKKNRHGCSQCKRNRTKCDEKRPTCGRCKRIGSACSLTSQSPALTFIPFQQPTGGRIDNEAVMGEPSLASFSRPAGSSNTSSSSNTTGFTARSDRTTAPEMQLLSALERDRLRLMNHYTLHTAKAMLEVTHPGHTDPSIWSNRVPELASQYDFLQYGLLSISALDMALHGVSRRKEHIILATNHYGLAVAAVRPYLTNNHLGQNPDTVGALFAFQCFVIAYAFRIQVCTEQPARSPIETIHNILVLLHRSPHSVVFQHEGSSALTPWVSLYPPPPSDPDRKLPAEIEAALDAIRRRLSAAGLPTTHATMYTSALQTLRTALLIAIGYHKTHMTYGYFPTCASVALCVLANYMVILHWRSTYVVHATRQILSAEWHPCFAWAISETERVGGNKGPAGLLSA
ncbi:Zn(II)2Cys6 transcription factor domain-containing protein [Aspergillus brunneoviolaceus CBS 621.78]|uniref:Uncharacterized protein n=1 Tax=Aspergillus brunneoviolaceus CBS 621.78 TaxID=1450534 RepID=A0ACD1G722_9EURO|nr:hypothetical protein BO95DRAFT_497640 [Aspergillus brunneoviolaceus CBS 621.78]RAH45086.1 hypothetical protein BO95DRAFT_497640 [Aspergillus brunneoviolaceus CBS 621.78]